MQDVQKTCISQTYHYFTIKKERIIVKCMILHESEQNLH